MSSIIVSNISDMILNGQEDMIESYVQTFCCKKFSDDGIEKFLNPDIERFIKTNAIQFAKMQTLMQAKRYIGGKIIYLDCDDCSSLTSFYESEGFRLVGERISDNDGRRYLQYMCFL